MDWLKKNGAKLVIALIVGGAAVALAWRTVGRDAVAQLPSTYDYVCAETGEIFSVPRGTTSTIPRPNPKTGRETLLRVVERDGTKYIAEREAPALDVIGDLNHCIDPKTLEIHPAGQGAP